MGYDNINKAPVITLPDGYSMGKVSEYSGSFEIYYDEREIGRVAWHGQYYTMYKPHGKASFYGITDYIRRDDAQQHAANVIVSMHKTLGETFVLDDGARLMPNTLMTGFVLHYKKSLLAEPNSWMDMVIGGIYRNISDNTWKLVQCFGDNEYTFDTIQEAVDTSIRLVKAHFGVE